MNFYDPKKTFLNLIAEYKGDLDEAFNLFEEGWSLAGDSGIENRTLREAIGIDKKDFEKFELDEISISDLLKKYGKAAASVSF